jgi:hypothetical protein
VAVDTWAFGPSDPPGFTAMACDELLVHTYDAPSGLSRLFATPESLAWPVLHRLFPGMRRLDTPPGRATALSTPLLAALCSINRLPPSLTLAMVLP